MSFNRRPTEAVAYMAPRHPGADDLAAERALLTDAHQATDAT